jgi:hypothetical protein
MQQHQQHAAQSLPVKGAPQDIRSHHVLVLVDAQRPPRASLSRNVVLDRCAHTHTHTQTDVHQQRPLSPLNTAASKSTSTSIKWTRGRKRTLTVVDQCPVNPPGLGWILIGVDRARAIGRRNGVVARPWTEDTRKESGIRSSHKLSTLRPGVRRTHTAPVQTGGLSESWCR